MLKISSKLPGGMAVIDIIGRLGLAYEHSACVAFNRINIRSKIAYVRGNARTLTDLPTIDKSRPRRTLIV